MSLIQIFTAEELTSLRRAGKILRECLQETARHVRPGVTTLELDTVAENFIRSHEGATPAFKGYHGFSGTLCTSVNEEAVHGIPGPRTLEEGDIVSLDGGVIVDGLYTDACITVGVGTLSPEARQFLDATEEALRAACRMIQAGIRVGDISHTIQSFVEGKGYKCLRALTGHGLGKTLHQYPDIPNVGKPGQGPLIPAGTILAIEPITSMGSDEIRESDDGWTLCTRDGALAAHFEHTLYVREDGCEILA